MKQISNIAPTIFDVARHAGVSRGTVDRVIYGRGRVSEKTKEKVRKVISELGYTPNPNASSLANRKEYVDNGKRGFNPRKNPSRFQRQ